MHAWNKPLVHLYVVDKHSSDNLRDSAPSHGRTCRLHAAPLATEAGPHPWAPLAAEPVPPRQTRPPPWRSRALQERSGEIPAATIPGELAGLPGSCLWWRRGEGVGGRRTGGGVGFERRPCRPRSGATRGPLFLKLNLSKDVQPLYRFNRRICSAKKFSLHL
jgi:hypothetical protein